MGAIEEYFRLRARIDKRIGRIRILHGKDITCSKGCSSCCINLTVFPVEFYAILQDLKDKRAKSGNISFNESTTSCGFLDEERLCRIYSSRPIICRTHGLPILFLNDSAREPEWEVSFCECNFQGKSQLEFDEKSLLDIEEINLQLESINKTFLQSCNNDYDGIRRIPLKRLTDHI